MRGGKNENGKRKKINGKTTKVQGKHYNITYYVLCLYAGGYHN